MLQAGERRSSHVVNLLVVDGCEVVSSFSHYVSCILEFTKKEGKGQVYSFCCILFIVNCGGPWLLELPRTWRFAISNWPL